MSNTFQLIILSLAPNFASSKQMKKNFTYTKTRNIYCDYVLCSGHPIFYDLKKKNSLAQLTDLADALKKSQFFYNQWRT